MQPYAPAPYRHQHTVLAAPKQQLSGPGALTLVDWALLVGGTFVGGAGINGLVGDFRARGKVNAINVGLNLILAAVGTTLFFQKGAKLIA
jgi:hypothetical protein